MSELKKVLWRSFFKVVKRAWGVLGDYILYTVGVRMGKLIAIEVKRKLKEDNLESLLKTFLDLWVQDGFVDGYIIKFYEAGIDAFFFRILGESSKRINSVSSFIQGFLDGFISKVIKKKVDVCLRELREENAWYRVYFKNYARRSYQDTKRDHMKNFHGKPLSEYRSCLTRG